MEIAQSTWRATASDGTRTRVTGDDVCRMKSPIRSRFADSERFARTAIAYTVRHNLKLPCTGGCREETYAVSEPCRRITIL